MNVADTVVGHDTWARVLIPDGTEAAEVDHRDEPITRTAETIRYAELPLAAIQPNPRQPRSVFDEEALGELAMSMGQIGLLQPVVVRPVDNVVAQADGRETPGQAYELVAGERRYRCAQHLGWDTLPAMIRPTDDSDLLRDALLENVHRAALNPLEEAAAYQQLLADFGCTQDELATRVGRSRPQIANTIRLLKLPSAVQRRVAAGILSQGHAKALLSLPDEQAMAALATRIVAEGLSVRDVEEIVAVGDVPRGRRPRTPRAQVADEGLADIAEELADHLDTRVQVSMGRTKGRVTIEFAGREDLTRIVDIVAGVRTTP